MALLPFELWDIIADSSDLHTKLNLLLVSRQMRKFTDPSFLRTVKLVVADPRPHRSPLVSFHKYIFLNEERRAFTRSFTLVYPHTAPPALDIQLIDELLSSFLHMFSLSLDFCYYEPDMCGHISSLHSGTEGRKIVSLLKSFSLIAIHGSRIDLTQLLSTQPELEHLVISDYSCTLGKVDPELKQLRAFEGDINSLIESNTSTLSLLQSLRSSMYIVSPRRLPAMNSLRSLSCAYPKSQEMDFMDMLRSRAPNLRFLEIHTPTGWTDFSKTFFTTITHIRLASDAPWSQAQARDAFSATETPPSLVCIEFPKTAIRYSFNIRATSTQARHLAIRYFRDLEGPVDVEWDCKAEDIWYHDWETDVQVVG